MYICHVPLLSYSLSRRTGGNSENDLFRKKKMIGALNYLFKSVRYIHSEIISKRHITSITEMSPLFT